MPVSSRNKTLSDRIEAKRKCRRSSCRVYASNLNRINKEFSSKPMNHDLKWLSAEAESILKKLTKMKNVNIARNLVSAAIIGFDVLDDEKNKQKYNTALKKLNEKKNQLQMDGFMSEKQKAANIPWPQIVKLRKLLLRFP